ncbi:hypothetical protein [Peribacillus butanolivorans]|uniref:hypothetical protein n=1 Tax=Peribacillus butanolivorans TaxID=421767 RepID=UPI0035E35437
MKLSAFSFYSSEVYRVACGCLAQAPSGHRNLRSFDIDSRYKPTIPKGNKQPTTGLLVADKRIN